MYGLFLKRKRKIGKAYAKSIVCNEGIGGQLLLHFFVQAVGMAHVCEVGLPGFYLFGIGQGLVERLMREMFLLSQGVHYQYV